MLAHTPAGGSTREVMHYAQEALSGTSQSSPPAISHSIATCFGLTRPSSDNCSPIQTAALHHFVCQCIPCCCKPSFSLKCVSSGMNTLFSLRLLPFCCVHVSVTCLRHAAIVQTQKSVNTQRNNRGSGVYSVPFRATGGRAVPHCTTLVSKATSL
jgi:hypothetical protein